MLSSVVPAATSASTGRRCRRGCSTRSSGNSGSDAMARVLLGVTGSVAAMYTRELFDELHGIGHDVKVVATAAALYFFDPAPLGSALARDADEWPGERY